MASGSATPRCPRSWMSVAGGRLVAAEAKAAGYGGIAAVWRATGVATSTIGRRLRDLTEAPALAAGRVRRAGGGRKPAVAADPDLMRDPKALVEPTARRSGGAAALDLQEPAPACRRAAAPGPSDQPHAGGRVAARARLQPAGQRQNPRGGKPPGSGCAVRLHRGQGQDGASGRRAGDLGGRQEEGACGRLQERRAGPPKGAPEAVRVHDFLIKELGRAVPYGVYDLAANAGWVGVGQDHDTAAFAGQTIRRWWQEIGRPRYPGAKSLTITADGGGSNGVRVRLWKRELQRLADESGLAITVHHLPPGISKWNAIEHRLFSFISQNWRATPLVSYRVIVDLIGATTTKTGLSVRCELDPHRYPKGVVVSDAEIAALNIERDEFHGEWNYTISPRQASP